jgi:RNA polymerase sigma-70 factor (ECF subfamily)
MRALGGEFPGDGPAPVPTHAVEPSWIEPYPDALLDETAPRGPDARYEPRETIGLPFIAALQDLAPHERAAIVLRDALGFDAEEAAGILGTSVGALAGTLRRARADFERRLVPRSADRAPAAGSPPERRIVQRFAVAFEGADVDAIVALLTDDAGLTIPPQPGLWRGREAVGAFLRTVPAGGALERFRLLATRANGQPAFGVYLDRRASGILVLTLAGEAISAITLFHGACLVGPFGLPDAVGG